MLMIKCLNLEQNVIPPHINVCNVKNMIGKQSTLQIFFFLFHKKLVQYVRKIMPIPQAALSHIGLFVKPEKSIVNSSPICLFEYR